MRTCAHCGGTKWGMVIQQMLTFKGYLYFCTKQCKRDYQKAQQQEVRKKQFFKWLHEERST